ncbi:flagellar motor switch protein FliM [Aequitasia blattaphilus]|uniref:Flagellar motor switch protein FliM n=1 Tax=Aequitasia blattaphilus TaxID=2949332 RepID=A0ABT1E9J9_9FIRM|nr:FliM/FliN family flagellar motor switch protein [Aequitasia blattaphilus]MCP1102514.1 FliM/FliN family flagellar motor switch protein [Aequitasia blattaphilus]MCR8615154.1 FliM/FliN family flagellar motor switch protein [Aequitasia blattaphilus]
MAEVLTQSQIDALLSEMENPDTNQPEKKTENEKPEYKKYDFYSPKKFTKERLKMINNIYDNYTRIASSRINSILRANCEMEVISVEEQRYHEFSNALSENDIIVLQPLHLSDKAKAPPMVAHISSGLMLGMMDRLLGGSESDEYVSADYSYTEIELVLYKKMMGYLLGVTEDAWSSYLKVTCKDLKFESNPGMFQEVSGEAPVAIILINVRMNKVEGRITVCIPGNLLERIFTYIDKQRNTGTYEDGLPGGREQILEQIKDSSLTVKAELGKAQLTLGDIRNLCIGDVIDLRKNKDEEITLYVEEQPWFECALGAYKKYAAAKVTNKITKKEVKANG